MLEDNYTKIPVKKHFDSWELPRFPITRHQLNAGSCLPSWYMPNCRGHRGALHARKNPQQGNVTLCSEQSKFFGEI